jgi:hypothetical protein
MTASDHATKPLRNTLRERGHPYMTLGASGRRVRRSRRVSPDRLKFAEPCLHEAEGQAD